MNRNHTAILLAAIALPVALAYAQSGGDPNTPPPGPPGKVFKTLNEVEPRTPLVAGASGVGGTPLIRIIEEPGSYYLTSGFEGQIIINADHVTLDLNGFAISPAEGQAVIAAIFLSGSNIQISDGFIDGASATSGFSTGVEVEGGVTPKNIRLKNLTISNCTDHGIYLLNSPSTIAENCLVSNVGKEGIHASIIRGCVASECGESALVGRIVVDSIGESSFDGLVAEQKAGVQGKVIARSLGEITNGNGILGDLITHSSGEAALGRGIRGDITHLSQGLGGQQAGIHSSVVVFGQGSTAEGVTAIDADLGIGFQTFGDGGFINEDYSSGFGGFPGLNEVSSQHLVP